LLNADGIACVVISQEARHHQHLYAIVLYSYLTVISNFSRPAYAKMLEYRNNQRPYPSLLELRVSY
jgi:hypothetical protein